MPNALDLANLIILNTDIEKGDIISNLKLQKLLYYMQGYHLAFFDGVFFEDRLEAWTYGPVVPDVYTRFKSFRASGIIIDPNEINEIELTNEQNDMFYQVMHEYGKFSALKLMEMTHEEKPWIEAYESNTEISTNTMKTFFKTKINE